LVEQHGPQGFTFARRRGRRASVPARRTTIRGQGCALAAVAGEGFELFGHALREAALMPAPSSRMRAQNVGVAYVLFAIEHPTRFRVMVGFGVQARMGRGKLAGAALNAYQLVRDVLVEGLQGKRKAETISDAEVLGWWSIVHGLAFRHRRTSRQSGDLHQTSRSRRPARIEAMDTRDRPMTVR
jgi:hypothetical protein